MIRFIRQHPDEKFSGIHISRAWLDEVVTRYGWLTGSIDFVFCDDQFLLGMNQSFLDHNDLTDIITFDNHEVSGYISGEIYISLDRVFENAIELAIDFEYELNRVVVHGVLHLIGYSDKTEDEKMAMRHEEDLCLSLLYTSH